MAVVGDHAIVLGASMSGLLAAKVLSDFYRTVTVVDRDDLPDEPVNRRGIPQGRHVHALLGRGGQIIDEHGVATVEAEGVFIRPKAKS